MVSETIPQSVPTFLTEWESIELTSYWGLKRDSTFWTALKAQGSVSADEKERQFWSDSSAGSLQGSHRHWTDWIIGITSTQNVQSTLFYTGYPVGAAAFGVCIGDAK